MLCYRDMTFCPFWRECEDGNDCGRAWTSDVQEKARAAGLPSCQFSSRPECFKKARKKVDSEQGGR